MNRLTVAYEPAISLIELLFYSSGVSLQGVRHEHTVARVSFSR